MVASNIIHWTVKFLEARDFFPVSIGHLWRQRTLQMFVTQAGKAGLQSVSQKRRGKKRALLCRRVQARARRQECSSLIWGRGKRPRGWWKAQWVCTIMVIGCLPSIHPWPDFYSEIQWFLSHLDSVMRMMTSSASRMKWAHDLAWPIFI